MNYRILTSGVKSHLRENRLSFTKAAFGKIPRGSTIFIDIIFQFEMLICDSEYNATIRTFIEEGKSKEQLLDDYPEFDRIHWDCEVRSFESDTYPQVGIWIQRKNGKVGYYD